ncbi:MAG TPA: DUF4956 domain-containing protein [Vicinamibacterales bacterium]|nr:DUF4956 domain-containing protein [Vicinamibacterales bacterium]
MAWLRGVLLALLLSAPVLAQVPPPAPASSSQSQELDTTEQKKPKRNDVLADSPDLDTQIEQLKHALARLPIAAALAAVLALRPRRRGTPHRQLPVIQTQIILAVVGAVVMLVVGSSLARAFGIVGAAGLVRYRAKIEDPKDAGVMLSTLAIGLASGVGLWILAGFGTVFILALLWIVESFEPKATQLFTLKIKTKDSASLKPKIEVLLNDRHLDYELRTSAPGEIAYDVHFPIDRKTARLSDQILGLSPDASVEWEEKKEKK